MEKIKDQLLQLFGQRINQKVYFSQIAGELKQTSRKAIYKALHQLRKEGLINKLDTGIYKASKGQIPNAYILIGKATKGRQRPKNKPKEDDNQLELF